MKWDDVLVTIAAPQSTPKPGDIKQLLHCAHGFYVLGFGGAQWALLVLAPWYLGPGLGHTKIDWRVTWKLRTGKVFTQISSDWWELLVETSLEVVGQNTWPGLPHSMAVPQQSDFLHGSSELQRGASQQKNVAAALPSLTLSWKSCSHFCCILLVISQSQTYLDSRGE